jgi:hypothetical protein
MILAEFGPTFSVRQFFNLKKAEHRGMHYIKMIHFTSIEPKGREYFLNVISASSKDGIERAIARIRDGNGNDEIS